uniref:Uncharacterized protein n=1 Tax=Anguilla anguilla TaxID=7936 RepID=A0A0E9QF34_ANGAN
MSPSSLRNLESNPSCIHFELSPQQQRLLNKCNIM